MEPSLRLVRYDLPGCDPFRNLACEEFLARTCPPDTIRLVFSRNAPTVVLGRNQNPWVEADLHEVVRRGITVARRASGGGTVYHDAGNLNYGFIMPRPLYSPPRFLQIVVTALQRVGVEAAACERSSVWVGDRKVSGTAFLLTGRTALLHGCILIDSDLDDLRRVLAPPAAHLHSRAVPSVRSPVTCLCAIRPDLSAGPLRDAITASAVAALSPRSGRAELAPGPAPAAVAPTLERLSSWEWIYGRTGDFEHVLRPGDAAITLFVREARVVATQVSGDATPWDALAACLPGTTYDGAALAAALAGADRIPAERRVALRACLLRDIPTLPLTPGAPPAPH